jgi:quercetin dioxygenase-like cupin family protein
MVCRMFCAAAVVCLAGHVALAQDPIKVEPKHYKLDFENDRVQVVAVHYGPHEKSEMHDHPGGVVISLTAGHLRFTDERGKTREVFAKPGEARWYPPFKHKVENLGDEPYNAVYVGVKTKEMTVTDSGHPPAGMDEQTAKILAAYMLASSKQ